MTWIGWLAHTCNRTDFIILRLFYSISLNFSSRYYIHLLRIFPAGGGDNPFGRATVSFCEIFQMGEIHFFVWHKKTNHPSDYAFASRVLLFRILTLHQKTTKHTEMIWGLLIELLLSAWLLQDAELGRKQTTSTRKNCAKHWAKHSSVIPGESGPFPVFSSTLGPAYNEFSYNKHPAVTSRFLCIKIIDCNVKKFGYIEYPLITSSFFRIF